MRSDELLKQGIAACKAGRKVEARELLFQALELDRHNEQAWLWLSSVVDTDAERHTCLEEVLVLNPANVAARRGLEQMRVQEMLQPPEPKPVVTPQPQAILRSEAAAGPSAPVAPPPGPDHPPAAPAKPVAGAEEKRGRSDMSWWGFGGAILVMVCVATIVLLAVLGSFEGLGTASPTDSPAVITSVVYENIAAHNAEDVERYMATIYSRAPGRDDMRDMLEEMYRTYDIKHTLAGVELLEASRTRAEVSFTLTTRRIRGPSFRDNRITGVFLLRKEDGLWKLYDQEVENVEYLE